MKENEEEKKLMSRKVHQDSRTKSTTRNMTDLSIYSLDVPKLNNLHLYTINLCMHAKFSWVKHLKRTLKMKYQAWCYIAWSVSFGIIHYCPATERICSIWFFSNRYRQAIYCMLNFLRWRWRRIYEFHIFFFNVCNNKLKSFCLLS